LLTGPTSYLTTCLGIQSEPISDRRRCRTRNSEREAA
jgi:hypothetical protein